MGALCTSQEGGIVAIDGKTARGSPDRSQAASLQANELLKMINFGEITCILPYEDHQLLDNNFMPTAAHSQIDPPKDWDEFEDIVCSAAKNRWNNPDFTRHGRSGQRQDGVDVYGNDNQGVLVGLQCKNTIEGMLEKTIKEEIEKAESFKPSISRLYIVTTAKKDQAVQKLVRLLSRERIESDRFGVEVLFWDDVWHDLTLNNDRLYQHYPHLKPIQQTQPQKPSHDQRLYEKFLTALPFDPAIRLLRDHDFGGPFPRSAIKPFYGFVETWDQPEFEFIDKNLQEALARLHKAALNLANHLTAKTVPVGRDMLYASVFSDSLRAQGPRPEWVREDARILNKNASAFVPIYEEFVRFCRASLEH